ncbi:MFS transporter [Paraburkholderia sp. Cy-641]|uniref:MFS transporter n=1 Tax=Paraburkholderia sp. Cy-641 TaxID=2608337 RepID=UPI0014213689|nr:MFS transporter [Paraburkholderia sp. Cy-641]NIF78751.1 MFS transporter [Paraburkholderia sp. Cy-641]
MSDISKPLPLVARHSSRMRWIVVLVLFGSVLVGFFDRISVAVLFNNPDFYNALNVGFNPTKLGFLMTAFLIAYGISSVVLSIIGDVFKPGKALSVSAVIWGVVMLGMGAAQSFGTMIFGRVVLGIMEGPQFSLIAKIVHRWFPPEERGRANAVWMVGSPIGSAVGFPLTLWLVHAYGWRASFYIFGVISLFIMAPLIFFTTRDRARYADPESSRQAVAVEAKEKVDLRLFLKDYRFWLVTAYGCGLLMYLWGLNSWLPTYLERVRHFNLGQMGIYSSLPFILMFIGEVFSGLLADRLGKRAILCFIGLAGAGLLLFAGTQIQDPHVAAIVIALSAGCWGLGLPAQYALAMDIIPVSVTSAGIGVKNGCSNLMGALAPVLIGWIVSTTGSFNTGLLVIVLGSLVGAVMMLPLIRRY